MKSHKNYSYLINWICDNKRFEIRKSLKRKSRVPFTK